MRLLEVAMNSPLSLQVQADLEVPESGETSWRGRLD